MKRIMTLACVLLFTTVALAGPGGRPMGKHRMSGHMDRNLFPPELVLRNQLALGLREDQIEAIKKLVAGTQNLTLYPQVDLNRVTEQLEEALEGTTVDEAAALKLAFKAMYLEQQVKTAHLTLMIRVKNLLTEEQQETARALRPERRMGPSDEIRD